MNQSFHHYQRDHQFAHLHINKHQALAVIAAAIISPLALISSHFISTSLYTQRINSSDDQTISVNDYPLEENLRVVDADPSDTDITVTYNPFSNASTDQVTADYPSQKDASKPALQTTQPTTPSSPSSPAVGGNPKPNTPLSPTTRTNALAGMSFYKEVYGAAVTQYNEWKDSRPADAALIKKIADQPIGAWIGGWTDESYIRSKMNIAASEGTAPIWIVYNLPHLNCGGGGQPNANAYKSWIDGISRGIGNGKSVVIVEPDALAMITCLNSSQQTERYNLIKYAVDRFAQYNPRAVVYIDAGHSTWINADTMASRLRKSGIDNAQGFSLNVSNFAHTAPNTSYGNTLGAKLDGAHFVIDTSRNGNGAAHDLEWCNPPGRALGQKPTVDYSNNLQDGLLWLKYPGESDEPCNGGPNAGVWWPEYALELSRNASW